MKVSAGEGPVLLLGAAGGAGAGLERSQTWYLAWHGNSLLPTMLLPSALQADPAGLCRALTAGTLATDTGIQRNQIRTHTSPGACVTRTARPQVPRYSRD